MGQVSRPTGDGGEWPGPRGMAGAIGGEGAGRPILSTAKGPGVTHPGPSSSLTKPVQSLGCTSSCWTCLSQTPDAPEAPSLAVRGLGIGTYPTTSATCSHCPVGEGLPL